VIDIHKDGLRLRIIHLLVAAAASMAEGADLLPRAEVRAVMEHLRGRAILLIGVFVIGFVLGYPAAEVMIEMLLDAPGYRPVGVEIVVLQPMEIILLKLRIAVQIGIALFALTLISDLAWNGRKVIAQGKRIAVPESGGGFSRFSVVLFLVGILGFLGFVYAHEILVPFLLDYLAQDASAAGLDSTWQLRSWIGFIIGLYTGSILSFQVPIVVVMLIRAGIIERQVVTDNRSFFWFAAAVIGALVSPPDPISMFLVGGPMLVLLEIALLLDRASS
tara:strand:+ start:2354 stop:3178 length:825 start_codon:yes stop_codon:yes gene_type:complete